MFIYFTITVLAECINVTLKVLHMAKIGGVGAGASTHFVQQRFKTNSDFMI